MAYDYSKFLSGMINANKNYYDPNSGNKPQVGQTTSSGWTYGSDGAWHGNINNGPAPTVSGGSSYTSQPINYAGLAKVAEIQKQQRIQQGTNKLNTMYGDAKNAQLEAIRRAANTAQTGLASSERTATQQAYNSRNMIDAEAAKNAMKLKEMMAAQGLLSSGENLTANMEQNNARLNSLNNVNQAETNTLQSIADKRNEINSSAASQEIELAKQIEADKAKAMMQLEQYEDERYLQQDRDAYNRFRDDIERQDKLAQQKFANEITESAITGEYNKFKKEIDQMNANTAAWWDSDEKERLRLSEENNAIGQQIGAYKNEAGDWVMPQALQTLQARQQDKVTKSGLIQSGLDTFGYLNPNYNTTDVGDFYGGYQGATPLRVKQYNDQQAWLTNPKNPANINANTAARNASTNATKATQPKTLTPAQIKAEEKASTEKQTNSDFAESMAYIDQDPEQALQEIKANTKQLIEYYGYSKYQQLLSAAEKANGL